MAAIKTKLFLLGLFVTVLLAGPAGAVTATWNAASDNPITASGYTASGTLDFALNFAPPVGTTLTVVKNTGAAFIAGTFSNVAQGQTVLLSYNGVVYPFVANYFGGTGNDLVLQWLYVRPLGWGYDGYGELGNNNTVQSNVPVSVLTTGVLSRKTVMALAAGKFHSLAVCSDGTLAAWGTNSSGHLGNNSTASSSVPVAVVQSGVLSGKTVIAVAGGALHSLALCSDGTVASWGSNTYGQLGNNLAPQSIVPAGVTQSGALSGKTAVAVAAGQFHNLALCSDGTVAAWGLNDSGQLGDNGVSGSQTSVPVAVVQNGVLAGKTVVAVAAGQSHNLALCSDGTLAAWGLNGNGQLGDNLASGSQSSVPVAVARTGVLAGKTITAISAGQFHSLALCSDGTLAAWGYNFYGQLGDNQASGTQSSVPVAVLRSGALSGKTVIGISGHG